jgi:hypothetical protein
MFEKLRNLVKRESSLDLSLSRNYTKAELDLVALLLKDNPERQREFENLYEQFEVDAENLNLFQQNAAKVIDKSDKFLALSESAETLVNQIVEELVSQTVFWDYLKGEVLPYPQPVQYLTDSKTFLSLQDKGLQFSGYLCKQDMPESSSKALLSQYKSYVKTGHKIFYNLFRQGLDILDLDPFVYELLNHDPNTMSNWLFAIKEVVDQTNFFKIPRTRIIKVPLALLQSTRVYEYQELSPLSLEIINRYAQKVFELDLEKDYFIKTGTFSSKFDFRNAKVTKGQEVSELGSYLWYIQHQANQMASPLNNRVIYGVSSNNEWVVREFIDDKENNPTIYNGLPLHTEYRVFVDFDTEEVIGISPYWHPEVMKENFLDIGVSAPIQKNHDYINYINHEETLMKRYEENKDLVVSEVLKLLKDCKLKGQWSIDVMQNGSDFWLIDMARASESALSDCVPKDKLKQAPLPFMLSEGLLEVGEL